MMKKALLLLLLLQCIIFQRNLIIFAHAEKEIQIFALMHNGVSLLADENGKILIPAGEYNFIREIWGSKNLFAVEDPDVNKQKIKGFFDEPSLRPVAIMNSEGHFLTDFLYSHVDEFEAMPSGDIIIMQGDKSGLIGSDGRVKVPPIFDDIIYVEENVYIVSTNNYDATDNIQISYKLYNFNKEGISNVVDIDLGYEIYIFNYGFHEGLCEFEDKVNGKYGYINTNGVCIIEPKYEYLEGFYNGYSIASLDGERFGLIDHQENWIVEPVFDDIVRDISHLDNYVGTMFYIEYGKLKRLFREKTLEEMTTIPIGTDTILKLFKNYIAVIDPNEIQIYDNNGAHMTRISQSGSLVFLDAGEGKTVRCYVSSQDAKYLCDITGQILATGIRIEYKGKIDEHDGSAIYKYTENANLEKSKGERLYGLIDDEGVIRIPAIYEKIDLLGRNCYFVVNGEEWGAIDIKGNWIVRLIGDEVQG